MTQVTPAMKRFVSAERFGVVGRKLTDRTRFDNKVLRWYQARDLLVTPVRPDAEKSDQAEGLGVLSTATDLPCLSETSISVIINPALGLPILKALYPAEPAADEPRAVWFQPGAESDDLKAYVTERNLQDRVVLGGPCILVLGDGLLAEVAADQPSKL